MHPRKNGHNLLPACTTKKEYQKNLEDITESFISLTEFYSIAKRKFWLKVYLFLVILQTLAQSQQLSSHLGPSFRILNHAMGWSIVEKSSTEWICFSNTLLLPKIANASPCLNVSIKKNFRSIVICFNCKLTYISPIKQFTWICALKRFSYLHELPYYNSHIFYLGLIFLATLQCFFHEGNDLHTHLEQQKFCESPVSFFHQFWKKL